MSALIGPSRGRCWEFSLCALWERIITGMARLPGVEPGGRCGEQAILPAVLERVPIEVDATLSGGVFASVATEGLQSFVAHGRRRSGTTGYSTSGSANSYEAFASCLLNIQAGHRRVSQGTDLVIDDRFDQSLPGSHFTLCWKMTEVWRGAAR